MRCGGEAVDAAAAEQYAADRGAGDAGDHVEQGGLAGAVGADDAEQLAGPHVEVHGVGGEHAAEAAAHSLKLQQRGGVVQPGVVA